MPAKPKRPAGPPPTLKVAIDRLAPADRVAALLSADLRDPFGFLGMHKFGADGPVVVRTFQPGASAVTVIERASGEPRAVLERLREEGFFAGGIPECDAPFAYRLQVVTADGTQILDDPYGFAPLLSDADANLLAEGSHLTAWRCMGAHPTRVDGVDGVGFAVWAPHAGRLAVIGSFNDWDGRRHGMRLRPDCGVWEIFIPGVSAGALYRYEIKSTSGAKLTDKSDPYAFQTEPAPGSASVVHDPAVYRWGDAAWMAKRRSSEARAEPLSIYELHLGSWRRKPEEGHRWLSYQEHADALVGYVKDLGFTHIQLLPLCEYKAEASLGYEPLAPFAPTSRWGTPDQLRLLVDRCHQAGIGVILDWVPNLFADDPHGLASFDGTLLYEHADAKQRHLPGSSSLVFDHGRREVANYLWANALFWLDAYHLDGLRLPRVGTMLYLDYSRSHGEWTPNRFGGHENLDAVDFLRRLNEHAYAQYPGIVTIAEDDSAWQRMSHPTFVGGLGFGFRWYARWVRDTLRYLSRNPVHRKYYHDELLTGVQGIFEENHILPLSHGEVAFGRGSLLRKMPGDRWQRFASLRTLYTLMFTQPGKKLMFMGDEFAQEREWNSDISLDWHMLGDGFHAGVQRLVRDLNSLYRGVPALHELDCEAEGFEWIDCNDSDQSIISFLRRSRDGKSMAVVLCNFTPVVRKGYRVGVPADGWWAERLNSDSEVYGGSNVGTAGGTEADPQAMHGRPFSLSVNVPPFASVVLEHVGVRPVGG